MTDWAALGDAYGPAGEIPGLLDQLHHPTDQARQDAIDELWSRLCHQETVYSASAAAVCTTAEIVDACRAAVAAQVPELVRWAVEAGEVAQAAALQLGVHHPRAFAAAGVPAGSLLTGDQPAPVRAGALLARAVIANVELDHADVRAAAATNADVLDYLDQALAGELVDRAARGIALELLHHVPAHAQGE